MSMCIVLVRRTERVRYPRSRVEYPSSDHTIRSGHYYYRPDVCTVSGRVIVYSVTSRSRLTHRRHVEGRSTKQQQQK